MRHIVTFLCVFLRITGLLLALSTIRIHIICYRPISSRGASSHIISAPLILLLSSHVVHTRWRWCLTRRLRLAMVWCQVFAVRRDLKVVRPVIGFVVVILLRCGSPGVVAGLLVVMTRLEFFAHSHFFVVALVDLLDGLRGTTDGAFLLMEISE